MKVEFIALGELLVDLITDEYCDSLAHAKTFSMHPGGSAANLAANLKWLGKNAALVSCIGNDGPGKFLLDAVKKSGLDNHYIQVHPHQPTTLVMVGRSKGTPDFVAYRLADRYLQSPPATVCAAATFLHTTAFALSQEPARTNILDTLKQARDQGKKISVDWNFAPSIWGADDGKKVFEELIRLKPYLKISTDDLERFYATRNNTETWLEILSELDTSLTCYTCGSEGVWYREGASNWQHMPAHVVDEVRDTTGAGDAFWSGVMCALLEKKPVAESINKGLETAALKIQKLGPLYLD